jgi:hypothetical protein
LNIEQDLLTRMVEPGMSAFLSWMDDEGIIIPIRVTCTFNRQSA